MYGYGYPFQPTRPLRDATRTGRAASALSSDFNPRVPCGTRLAHTITAASSKDFNPRVPCGTRLGFGKSCGRLCTFQPTRPLRDATATIMPTAVLADHFNPRVPCGTRLLRGMEQDYMHLFQPTRPLRDATAALHAVCPIIRFQPTRPLRDATCLRLPPTCLNRTFQPTRPLRDATRLLRGHGESLDISTHASLAGRDPAAICRIRPRDDFNPRVPCGTRQQI